MLAKKTAMLKKPREAKRDIKSTWFNHDNEIPAKWKKSNIPCFDKMTQTWSPLLKTKKQNK